MGLAEARHHNMRMDMSAQALLHAGQIDTHVY